MKIIAGHRYLKGSDGFIMPYSELLEKASGYESFVAKDTIVNDMQFSENDAIKSASERVTIPQASRPKTQPNIRMQHMDIREDIKIDLSGQ